jgi:hypothetical protein
MTNILGRLFVLLVFTFSLGFLALAVGVYANHLTFKGKTKDKPGIVDALQERINQQAYARDRAKARYDAAYKDLANVELLRSERQKFYAAKLEMLQTGKDEKGNIVQAPVFVLKPKADGFVEMKMIGDPADVVQFRGLPLEALAVYQQRLATLHTSIIQEQDKIDGLQKKLADLTNEMQGPTGLIAQQAFQVEARTRTIVQQEFWKPMLANRFAEATMLLKREKELRQRLEQLDKGR